MDPASSTSGSATASEAPRATLAASDGSPDAALPVPENDYPRLRDMLAWAWEQSPRMQAQRDQTDAAIGNRMALRAGLLPGVSAWAQYQPFRREIRKSGNPTNSDKLYYQVSASQPLYYWGVLRNTAKIGRLQLANAQQGADDEYQNLVQDIRTQYLQLIIKRVLLQRAEYGLQRSQHDVEAIEQKLKLNAAALGEVVGLRQQRDQAELTLERLREDYRRSVRDFSKLCGIDRLGDADIPAVVNPVVIPLEHLRKLTADFVGDVAGHAPSLASTRNQIEIENLNYKNAKARLRPKLDFVTGLTMEEQRNLSSSDPTNKYGLTTYYAGFQVSWSIFDGFAAKGNARSALARRRSLERSYQQKLGDLAGDANDLLKQVEFTVRIMKASDDGLLGAEGWVAQMESDLRLGRAAEDDLAIAQRGLLDAKINAYNARVDCMLRTTALLAKIFEDPAVAAMKRKTP